MKGLKVRFYFNLFKAFWQKRQRIIIASLAATILFVLFIPRIINLNLLGHQQKIGLVGRYQTTNLPTEITSLISYGLTIPLPDGSVEPGLAESWTVEENGKVYIFTLKENLTWHDGSQVKAKDINYNFSDVNMTILDDRKIKFELKEAFSPFPIVVSRPIFKKKLVGLGDYKASSIQQQGQIIQKLTLKPASEQKKPHLSFRFYPNEEAARTGFKLGEVQELQDLSSPGDLENWVKAKVESTVKHDRYTAIFFNSQTEKFADKPVRQALAYAIEKVWEPRALSSYNPNSWAYNDGVKTYEYDLANAKSLLGQNGESSAIDKITLSTVPSLLPIAEKVKLAWSQLDVETEIKIIHSPTEDFEAILVSQQIPKDPDQYVLWHSTQSNNLSRYKSPKLDKLLEDGRKEFDQDIREAIYLDFQRFLVEESPAVFLFHPTVYSVSRK